MPDIAMCHGGSCSRKAECYRYRAIPTPQHQAYYEPPPVDANGGCAHFLVLRRGDQLTELR
jgi:hypothetical protein